MVSSSQAQGLEQSPWCGTDLSSETARANLAAYARARDAGLFDVARKTAIPPVIGEVREFNVLDGPDLNEAPWRSREFELVDITDHYYQWVDATLWTTLSQSKKETALSLSGPMETAAPPGAFRQGHGIIANDLYLFGGLPELDDDGGIIDILMYDIEDDGNGSGVYTAGFVHSADINPDAAPGVGNQRLVLYLDGAPRQGLSSITNLAGVAAHELTHLIHYGNGALGLPDETFEMEGLAEYGMIANGYFWRGTGYLADSEEMTLPLFSWRQDILDYQRASLFFGYLADRIGPEATGSIVRENATGWIAVKNVLTTIPDAPTFNEITGDFHTANVINDQSLAPEFGYSLPYRAGVQALLPPPIDGNSATSTSESLVPVEGGSVQYRAWQDVRNFAFRFYLDPADPDQFQFNGRMRARLVTTDTDGGRAWHDLEPSLLPTTITGSFSEVILILYNGSGAVTFLPEAEYEATWEALSTDLEPGTELPTEAVLSPAYPNPFNPSTEIPFTLPVAGPVRLRVFDVLGRHVATLEDGYRAAGVHSVRLDATGLSGGTYLLVLETEGRSLTRTVTYLP